MAQTSLQQAMDNRGLPYPAISPAKSWIFAMSGVTTYPAGPFLAATKVVRIVAGSNDIVRITFNGMPAMIIARGIYQDLIVYPGDAISLQLDPLSASGNCSITELA